MSWPDVIGHDQVFESFRRMLKQGRLASTFLFLGPSGIGKRTTALRIAQALLCENSPASELTACEACSGCQQVVAQTHPDLILVRKPDEKSFIPVELFIGDRDHRMREGLCHDIALKPFRGGRKIAIIDDADLLNQEGANCLLKTLEEPPPGSLIILIGTSRHRQLPTIRSRSQVVRFAPLSDDQVATLLSRQEMVDDPERITSLARRSNGSLTRALELADPDLEEGCQKMLRQLGQLDYDAVALAKEITAFVEAVGKDVPARRVRLRKMVEAAAEFYRQLMRNLADPTASAAADAIQPALIEAEKSWNGRVTVAAACVERCLEAITQIEANANLATLVAAWTDDLSQRTIRATRD